MRAPLRIVLSLALVAAGCLGADTSAEPAAGLASLSAGPAAAAGPVHPTVEPASGTVRQMAAGACITTDEGFQCCCASSFERAQTSIAGAAASGVVRLEWDASTPLTERMHVSFRNNDGFRVHAEGTSPIELRIEDAPPGAYTVAAWFSGVAGTGVQPGYADQEVRWSVVLDAAPAAEA